jgi:hypothetical protein
MIRYTLKCSDGHNFESWFKSASAFESLHAAGQLTCPQCGAVKIEKSLMAPRLHKSTVMDQGPSEHTEVSPTTDATPQTLGNATTTNPKPQDVQAPQQDHRLSENDVAKIRDHVEKNSDYVGADFTKQARAMRDGDAPERSIYGEAKLEDAKALIAEGVPVVPLPFLPKRKLN